MNQLGAIRKWQCFFLAGVAFAYLVVYRNWIAGKSVMNSTVFHQTANFIKQNQKAMEVLGPHIHIMNCNGKKHPMSNKVNFDLLLYGTSQKGKLVVKSEFDNKTEQWKINKIDLLTANDKIPII